MRMSRFAEWLMCQQSTADAELMAQLETAHQAIIELQNDNDALRSTLRKIIHLAGGIPET